MPRSKAGGRRRDREKGQRRRPHRPATDHSVCRRCGHHWPCPSVIAGIDLSKDVPCNAVPQPEPGLLSDLLQLKTLDIFCDSGRRKRVNGTLEILWVVNPRVAPFMHDIVADLDVHGLSPDEEDIRTVVRWLSKRVPVNATRAELAASCAADVELEAPYVERCLFWAQVFGFVGGPVGAA